jgi:hypothetical protein
MNERIGLLCKSRRFRSEWGIGAANGNVTCFGRARELCRHQILVRNPDHGKTLSKEPDGVWGKPRSD